ncbi:MAG: HAMP domain-containing sensor histidine kinase [Anaerolineae bacterium]
MQTPNNPFSEFLASITHEFRTPLSGMKATIELLQRDAHYLSPAELDELLGSLHLSVSSLQTLVDNLLETAKIDSGHFVLRRRTASFNAVLVEALHIMQPLIDRRDQTLTLSEPFSLPPLLLDPVRMVQVIVNLLSNASAYSPLGESIDLTVRLENAALWFDIADRGSGIEPEARDYLFQRFVRANSDGQNDGGVGLGLSVVKAIIEGHGGQIRVESRPGSGSIFSFRLPIETTELGSTSP